MSLELFDDPELDRALASGLSALAPEVEPADITLAALRPRFHRARTRRRVLQGTAAMAALLVVGSAAFAAAPSARRAHVTVESPDRRTATTTVPKRGQTSTSLRHANTGTKRATKRPTVSAKAPTASSAPTASAAPGQTVAPSAPASRAAASTSTAAPSKAAPAPRSLHYTSSGGSIAVRFANGRLSLAGVYAAKGYHPNVVAERSHRIDVEFTRRGRWGGTEIEVTVVNGRIVPSVRDNSWTSRGISSASSSIAPFIRPRPVTSLPLHRSQRGNARGHARGRGGARLVSFRIVLPKHGPSVEAKMPARPSGKHGASRSAVVPVDE